MFGSYVNKEKKNIGNYWFLFRQLVKRDFTRKYKRTTLGMAWSMLSPLMNLMIMWTVFRFFFGMTVEHYVVYLFSGQIIYSFFSDSTNMGMDALISNSTIFTKVNIPKVLFLLSQDISSFINFVLTFIILIVLSLIDGVYPTCKWGLFVFLFFNVIIFNIGVGLVLSALNVFFGDMKYLWGIIIQMISWLSAIFYTIDTFPADFQMFFYGQSHFRFYKLSKADSYIW